MKYKLTDTAVIHQDTTIKLKFEGGSWATMTFQENYPDDDSRRWWNVIIASDWGQWSYGWSYSGMGKRSIYDFMYSMRKDDYLQRNFIGAEEKLFDKQATAAKMRKEVREKVPWIKYKEEHENLMYMISEMARYDDERDFLGEATKELHEVCARELWYYLTYEIQPRTNNFFKNVFPKFFPAIKKLSKQK